MTHIGIFQRMKRFTLLAAILSSVGCKTVTISERDLLQPDQRIDDAATERRQDVERFVVSTQHGDISVTRVHREGNRVSVLYFGGNQFRTSQSSGGVARAFPADVDLILFDYPGYGESSGTPTLESMFETSLAVYDAVEKRTSNPVFVYGASMGGFMASHVASEREVFGLMLEGTAPDTKQWVRSLIPWFAKPFVRVSLSDSIASVDNVDRLSSFNGPILMMVGDRDTQTRPQLMRSFAEAMRSRGNDVQLIEIPGRGHGELLDVEVIRNAIAVFLRQQSELGTAIPASGQQ